MPRKNDNASDYFDLYKNEKTTPKAQNIEKDYRGLVGKSLNSGSPAKDSLSECSSQNRLFASELSSFFRKIRYNEHEFSADKPISDIKYYYPNFQNNNPFYLFNNQLDYVLATSFVKSKTTKGKINQFLFN